MNPDDCNVSFTCSRPVAEKAWWKAGYCYSASENIKTQRETVSLAFGICEFHHGYF